jgi:histidine triad (HIT) family protein
MDCLFCKIIRKEIPNYTVYEDENVLAFLDIFPCSKGHAVVIPKQHYGNLSEMSAGSFQSLAEGLRVVVERVQMILQPDGMNIGINNGKVAGQAVPHVHWHIIPRYIGDGGGSMHSIVKNPGETMVSEVAELFKR